MKVLPPALNALTLMVLALSAPAPASAAPPSSVPVFTVVARGGGLGAVENQVTIISRVAETKPGAGGG